MVKQCITALFLGFLATIWFLQHDPRIQERVGKTILQGMESAYECTMQGHVTSLSLSLLTLDFEDVYAYAPNGTWSWYAQRLTISCSWLDLLLYGTVLLDIDIYGCRADSDWDKTQVGILDFIYALNRATPTSVPLLVKSLQIHQASAHIYDAKQTAKIHSRFSYQTKKFGKQYKSIVSLYDAVFRYLDQEYISDGQGTITLQTEENELSTTGYTASLRYTMPAYPSLIWTADGSWNRSHGSMQVKSTDNRCSLVANVQQSDTGCLQATFEGLAPADLLEMIVKHEQASLLKAELKVHGTAKKDTGFTIEGLIEAQNVFYKENKLADMITTNVHISEDVCTGDLIWTYSDAAAAMCWSYDRHQQLGSLQVRDQSHSLHILGGNWCLEPESVEIDGFFQNKILNLTYTAQLMHAYTRRTKKSRGTCHINQETLQLKGVIDSLSYQAEIYYKPALWIRSLSCSYNQAPCVLCVSDHPDQMCTTFDLAKSIALLHSFDVLIPIQAEGIMKTESIFNKGCVYGNLALHDGAIRIPQLYNVAKNIAARYIFDSHSYDLIVRDVSCALHRGTISCDRARIWWHKDGRLRFAHVPILLHNCFVNITKDFFTLISGYLVASLNTQTEQELFGSIYLDKARFRYPIFSSQLAQQLPQSSSTLTNEKNYDAWCNILIHTKDPLYIKTAFLETEAKIALSMTGRLKKPELQGSIELLSGECLFPYKPLHITKGSILFSSHTENPTISLFAKNNIREYQIHLHINGSLHSPQFFLESSPHLTEEQILALLFGGTKQNSLNLALPALITHNLKNLLCSSDQGFSPAGYYIYQALKPLRYINVIPSFIDQSGRAGLRGALEVEVSDRLHAYVQKNFALTEDTRVEVEYALSDEIHIKGVRDEHGDIGAEIEIHWKR